ncbi:hypothetical protein JNM87_01910 [Candidatus Saccharibacteria bacterium]|nr:hypothetical protein [Candidatus Saccharibacteria bacterium]
MQNTRNKLVQMPVANTCGATSQILEDLKRSKYFRQTFHRFFFSFVDVMGALQFQLTQDVRDRLRLIFEVSILTSKDPNKFVSSFVLQDFRDDDTHTSEEYLALFQNAFIYATAICYKSQIKGSYMRASEKKKLNTYEVTEYIMTGKARGSTIAAGPDDKAPHPDSDYVRYLADNHPLFSTYVKSKHRFQHKKILTVAGYIINPNLNKE